MDRAKAWRCRCPREVSTSEERCPKCLGWRSPSHQVRQRLLERVRAFIDEHEIGHGEVVHQSDAVALAALDFILDLGEIVGWVEWDEESGSCLGVPPLPDEVWPHLDGSEGTAQ